MPCFHVVRVARSLTSQCLSLFLSKRIIPLRFLTITKVEVHGWQRYVLVSVLVVEVVLIAEDMGVLLVCNLLQSQDASIQTNVSENRVVSDGLPSLDSLERRLEMTNREAIPLMPRSSGSGWATREMGTAFAMAGASYLPWLAGTLEEHPGEGYWLSFNQRLPISYELGDHLYGLLHCSRLVRDEEDAEGEVAEDAVEEEII